MKKQRRTSHRMQNPPVLIASAACLEKLVDQQALVCEHPYHSFIMRSSLSLASLSLALGATAEPWSNGRKYGSTFYSGPTSNAYITKATYSVVPPDTPCNYHTELPQGELSLWVGVQDDPTYRDLVDMNLVQPLVNWAPDQSLT